MRRPAVILLLALSWIAAAAAQAPVPTERPWSIEGREPQWRVRLEASGGSVSSASILQRDQTGLVLAVREDKDDKQTTFIERRDRAGQLVWRHPVPGLPARYGAFGLVVVEGKTRADLTLAAVFNPADPKPGDSFAHLIEVDVATGSLRMVGGFTYPQKKRATSDDWMELTHAKAMPSGLIAFYGGIGSGPFAWWIGLRKPDGTPVWDVISRRSLGHVVDLRADGEHFDVLLVNIMSFDLRAGTGTFRLRIDAAGKIVASAKLWQRESAPRFMPDGGMAYLVHREKLPTIIEVQDRRGHRRFARALTPDTHGIEQRLDDGAIVLSRDKGFLILEADGNSMIAIPDPDYDMKFLADGTVVYSRCEGRSCKVRTLSLFDRPR